MMYRSSLYHLVTLRHGDDMPLLVGREYCRSAAMDMAKRAAGPGASFIYAFPEPFSCAYQGPNGIAVVSW